MEPFIDGLMDLINKHSRENISNVPDFILAEYLCSCLNAFNEATKKRDDWYKVHLEAHNKKFLDESTEKVEGLHG